MRRLMVMVIWWACASAFAAEPQGEIAVDKQGVAVRGYDAVAYFTEKRAVKGLPQFAARIEGGAIYHFATAENLAIFLREPIRYAPQYGGFCAAATAKQVAPVPADPAAFRVVDGKLFVFSTVASAREWSRDAANNISKADVQWSARPKTAPP